jgi:hypothetical protein
VSKSLKLMTAKSFTMGAPSMLAAADMAVTPGSTSISTFNPVLSAISITSPAIP